MGIYLSVLTDSPVDMKDVVIVGSGPAGLFAAHELADGKDVLVLDMGKDVSDRECPLEHDWGCEKCEPCDIMCGLGGAGTFSGGRLNLRPDIGGDLADFVDTAEDAWKLVEQVDGVFLEHGAPDELTRPKRQTSTSSATRQPRPE